jgi:signal transduction histidine kinase
MPAIASELTRRTLGRDRTRVGVRRRIHMPRQSIRLRLTLLYGGLFLVSGATLLTIVYILVARTTRISNGVFISGFGKTSIQPPTSPVDIDVTKAEVSAAHAAMLRQLLVISVVMLVIMAVASVLAGWWMAGRALRPMREMTGKARRLSEANLHERLAVTGPDDELKELGDTFDGLLARLDWAFEAERRFVANASHELRTPLTLQRAMIEVALADPDADAEALRRVCERLLAAGADQERLIGALLTLARGQRGLERREPVDLAKLAARAAGQGDGTGTATAATPGDVSSVNGILTPVRVDLDLAPAIATGDGRLLERLVGNLIDNAVRHNVPGGWVSVRTCTHHGQGLAMFRVVNSGPVIPPDRIGMLVQPFQRLESRTGHREGHGLGLSIAAAVAGTHRAHLAIEPRPEGGLDVTVTFRAGQ